MSIKVVTLEGLDSYYPCQGYYKLMFGLNMLPAYLGMSTATFLETIDKMDEADQEKMIREAIRLVRLEPEEVMDIIKWACDANGVRYSKENTKNLTPQFIIDILTAVCLEVAKAHKIDLISDREKKKLKISPLTSDTPLQNIQPSH